MTEKTMIDFLKSNSVTPPEEAVERCIHSLPPIRRQSILPLISLQLRSLPWSMYGIALLVIGVQLRLVMTMEAGDALMASGIVSALVALMLAWHLTMSATEGMTDIERCCRYSYGQILLSRILCLCLLTAGAVLLGAVPGAIRHELGFRFVALALLPTASGALAAILWAGWRRSTDLALMSVYLVTSVLVSLNLTSLMRLTPAVLITVILLTAAALFSKTKTMLTRSIEHEAYHF